MGQFRFAWCVAFASLFLMVSPGLMAPGTAHAQDDPRTSHTQPQVDVTTVESEVRSLFYLMRGINNDLAEMFTSGPAFFCRPPGSPTKAEASAQLDAIQLRIDAAKARSANLRAQIAVLERNNNNIKLYKNWDPTNLKRFDNLDKAERAMLGEMKAARARLAAIPEKPCGRPADPPPGGVERVPGGGGTPPPPPPPYDPGIDERQVPGLPGGKPTYRDLQAIALPDFFCSYQDRSSFLWGTFWPWHDATAKEVGESYNYAARLEAHASQLRRAGNDAAADATKRLADHANARAKAWGKAWEKLFDDTYKRFDAIKVVPCDEAKKPLTTPQPPLPPGYFDTPHRPALDGGLRIPTPPKSFCTAQEKHHYLMHVYFPLAEKANENARLAAAYMHDLSVRLQKALAEFGPDSPQYRTLRIEYQAYAAIRKAAIDFADQVTGAFRASIEAIPIVDCHPPVPGREEITTPQPPLPPPPPQLPPSLNRPQFERWEMPRPPKSFCSETERVAFLNTVYTPASTRALANAERSAAYRAQLNKAFTETMRNDGGPVWAAVQAEIAAWTPIDNDARAKAEAVRALYATIMAVPVVNCDPPKGPVGETGGGVGKPAPPPSPLYKTLPNLGLPDCFRSQAEFDAFLAKIAEARALAAENFKAANDYGKALDAYIEGRKAAGDEEGVKLGRDVQDSFSQSFLGQIWLDSQRLGTIADRARLVPACPPVEGGRLIELGGPLPFTRPLMGSIHLGALPRFCTEAERQKYLDQAYDALDVVDDNMDALDAYDDYLDKRRAEPLSAEAFRRGMEQEWIDKNYEVLDTVGWQIEQMIRAAKAAQVGCPDDRRTEKPCPPSRNPISVGSNSQVGSGARTREKVASTAMGLVGGLIGGGGGGGGGGGSDGPQLLSCKIKDKEMTLFDDPATGVSLGVAAKEGKNGLTVFAKVMKSPDSGTFQAAFLENGAGDQQAPSDVGICGLWGEWKLTVSWTRTTYVDGQVVKREHGGWSKGGTFSIPGVVSSAGRPDGLWRRLGFSNASHGARQIAMTYKATPEDFAQGPVGMVLHVTRPGGNPVTTVPFVLQMTRTPGGIVFERADKTPCEKGEALQVGSAGRGAAMC